MALVKRMIETPRYKAFGRYLGKKIKCTATYQKHGINKMTHDKTTCINNIIIDGKLLTDHVWIETELIAKARPKQGQKLNITLVPKKRIRPGSSIEERLVDVTFRVLKAKVA